MTRPERWLFYATLLLALGAGILSLILFWFALLGIGWSVGGVGALWLVSMGGVIVVLRRYQNHHESHRPPRAKATRLSEPQSPLKGLQTHLRSAFSALAPLSSRGFKPSAMSTFVILIIVAIAAAVLFNGSYFPFARDDTLGIYRPTALAMWQTGTLEPLIGADSLYRTYPILVPLNYTFAYLVSGWENEYLAKSIATLLSLGCLPAVYFLGRDIAGRRTGLLAALILALTPSFVRWGSSGYVDLPLAFYYTLGAMFALRFYRDGGMVDAALAGVMIGFAAITKNAGLIGIPLLAGWFGLAAFKNLLTQRREDAKLSTDQSSSIAFQSSAFNSDTTLPSFSLRLCVFASIVSLSLAALITAPWYIRNLTGAGFLIPDTAWTDQAERTLQNLAIFVTLPDNFAASGWLVLAGIAFAAWQIARRQSKPDSYVFILWFTLPFFTAWWLFVSYDPRFLLLFYPILCVGAGRFAESVLQRAKLRRPAQIGLALVIFALAVYCLWIAVEFKGDILRNPLMSHEEKIALVRDQP